MSLCLSVVMLSVVMQSVIMLNVVMLNVVMLSVVMLKVIMLNVIMLSVVAPYKDDIYFFLLVGIQSRFVPGSDKMLKRFLIFAVFLLVFPDLNAAMGARYQCYKTFYARNLQSRSVCLFLAFAIMVV
jgi:hypothetical protein